MKRFICICICLVSLLIKAQSGSDTFFNQKFSQSQLQEDVKILRMGLEKIHPGLYRYTEKKEMDSLFMKLWDNLEPGGTYREFYKKVCKLVAQVKCQHTVAAPAPDQLDRMVREAELFPLKVFWEFDPVRAYIMFDLSNEANRLPGTRIVSINGRSMEEIYTALIPFFSSDGNILSNKHSRLQVGMEFQFWYHLLLDGPKTFEVILEKTDGERFTKIYEPVTLEQGDRNYRAYLSQKDPQIRKYLDHYKSTDRRNRTKPVRFEFLSNNIALLTVGNFDTPDFEAIISKAFEKIREKKIQDLIIDVRYNGGGNDIFGRYLFSHLIKGSAKYLDSLYTNSGISDTTFLFTHTDKDSDWMEQVRPLVQQLPDGRFVTKPEVNLGLMPQHPDEDAFNGNVYVLMNGRSASTTAEFTSALHFNKGALFIGEESGGAYHGGHGGDFAQLRLPNTKITVQIPLSKYVMNSLETRFVGRGTPPDHTIHTTIQDILNLKDPQLELALKLIMEK